MDVLPIPLNRISDNDRLRPVDPALVQVIAESIRDRGQMTPIEVAAERNEDGSHKLIDGAHRVAALRMLGWVKADAIMIEASEAEARLREIDHQLCHADLNELDRAIFLGERKRLYYAKVGKKGEKDEENQDVAKMANVLRFTLETARQTKLAERTIRRLVARYNNLAPNVRDRLKGTWIASSGKDLDALAKLVPFEQEQVVEMMLREQDAQPDVVTALRMVRGVTMRPRTDADEEFSRLLSAWRKAGRQAKQRFREFLESPESRKAGA